MKKQYIIYLIGFIYLLINANAGINPYDEGLPLVGGMRLLNGELPLKDFWTIYPPGIYIISALIQLITESVLVFKIISLIVSFFTAVSVNSIYNKLSQKESHIPFLTAILLFGFGMVYLSAASVALLFALLSVSKFVDFITKFDKKSILYSALFAAIAGIFRHDFAAYLVIIQLMVIFVSDESELKNKGEALTQYLFGITPLILFFLLTGILVGFDNFYSQLIKFPVFEFGSTRSLDFPTIWGAFADNLGMKNLTFKLWLAIVFLVPPLISVLGYAKYRNRVGKGNILFLGLIVLIFYNQALNRSDFVHLLPSLIFSIPVLMLLFDRIKIKNLIMGLVLVLILSIPLAKKLNNLNEYYFSEKYEYTEIHKLNGILVESDLAFKQKEYLTLLNSIESKSVYIGLKNHSSFEQNNVMLYYLADIMPPTRYHECHPGVVDKEEIQKEMLKEIELNTDYALLLEYGTKEDDEGSNILDYYFRKYYQPIIRKEDYLFLAKSNFTELK